MIKLKNISKEARASVAYTICSIIQKGLSFITLPLFTRILTTEQFGQSTVYSSWQSILTIFITMNLAYGSFQTAMVKFENSREEYTSSISLLFAILGFGFLLIYYPFRNTWNLLFELPTIIMVLMVVEVVFNGISDCWFSKNRFEFKYWPVIIVSLIKSVVGPLIALLFVLNSTEKGYARIIGFATVNILFGVVLYALVISKGKTFFNRKYWKYALSFNLPLIPYYIAQMVFNTSDRIMISHINGISDAAIYGVAYSLALVLNFVISAINSSYSPWFMIQLKNKQGEKNKKVSINLSIVLSIGLWMIIAIAPEFIKILAGDNYLEGVWAVPPVALSVLLLFYTQLFDRVLFYYEKKKYLILGGLIPCIVNLVLNYYLLPVYGFVAAAYTTLISYIIFVLINYYTAKRVLIVNQHINEYYDIKKLFFVFLVLCIMSALVVILYNYILIRIGIVFLLLIVIIFKRKSIEKMIALR